MVNSRERYFSDPPTVFSTPVTCPADTNFSASFCSASFFSASSFFAASFLGASFFSSAAGADRGTSISRRLIQRTLRRMDHILLFPSDYPWLGVNHEWPPVLGDGYFIGSPRMRIIRT